MIPYMVGKLAPNSSHLTRALVKYGMGYFRAVPSQNGDKYVTSPPSQSLNLSFQQFRGKAVQPHCFRVCHCFHKLWQSPLPWARSRGRSRLVAAVALWNVGIELVGFGIQQRAEESHPSFVGTPLVTQQSAFLVTDALWFDLLRCLQRHGFDVLKESMLISHAQLFIQLNDVALEKTNGCCTSHSLNLFTCLPDDPLQLRIPGVHF